MSEQTPQPADDQQPAAPPPPELTRETRIWEQPWFNLLAGFAALIVVFGLFAVLVEDWAFVSSRNLENILRQSAVYATAALGMTMVIITAGIDLSIGSIIALCVVVVAMTLNISFEGADGEQVFLIHQWPTVLPILAVVLGVIAAALAGAFNGSAIVWLRLPPFIVTLGSMLLIRGVGKDLAQERDIYPPEDTWISNIMDPVISTEPAQMALGELRIWFVAGLVIGLLYAVKLVLARRGDQRATALDFVAAGVVAVMHLFVLVQLYVNGYYLMGAVSAVASIGWVIWLVLAGLPLPKLMQRLAVGLAIISIGSLLWYVSNPGVKIMIFAAIFSMVLLRYTRFGRHVYAVGSNEETARLCGVPVGRTKILVYALAGLFAGLAGLMQFSFIGGIGQPTTAVAYELFVIAAVVVGGASLMGGEGTILGSLIGAVIITILYMGGQQVGLPKARQEMLIGGIIIAAVALDQLRHRKLT